MLLRNLILSLLAAVGLSFLGWRLGVRESLLKITSDELHFPTVSGSNLDRDELVFPRDFASDLNLLFVPFQQYQQLTVNTWIPFAQDLELSNPDVIYYELPTIDERSMLSRTFINEGMRAGIPDQTARERTVTLYIDTAKFMQTTGIPDKDEVHIFLVDRQGNILWRETGNYDEGKGKSLLEIIQSHQK